MFERKRAQLEFNRICLISGQNGYLLQFPFALNQNGSLCVAISVGDICKIVFKKLQYKKWKGEYRGLRDKATQSIFN